MYGLTIVLPAMPYFSRPASPGAGRIPERAGERARKRIFRERALGQIRNCPRNTLYFSARKFSWALDAIAKKSPAPERPRCVDAAATFARQKRTALRGVADRETSLARTRRTSAHDEPLGSHRRPHLGELDRGRVWLASRHAELATLGRGVARKWLEQLVHRPVEPKELRARRMIFPPSTGAHRAHDVA